MSSLGMTHKCQVVSQVLTNFVKCDFLKLIQANDTTSLLFCMSFAIKQCQGLQATKILTTSQLTWYAITDHVVKILNC